MSNEEIDRLNKETFKALARIFDKYNTPPEVVVMLYLSQALVIAESLVENGVPLSIVEDVLKVRSDVLQVEMTRTSRVLH